MMNPSAVDILLRDYNASALVYVFRWTVVYTLTIILKLCLFNVWGPASYYYYIMS